MTFGQESLKFLNLGINSEIAAYLFYKQVMKKIDDKALSDILAKLAMDEKHHFLSLEDAYDRQVRSEMWAPYKDILSREGLPDIDELVQDTHKELLAKAGTLKTKRDVLEMALALEKEAYDLFSGASAKAKTAEEKKIFDYLSAFEKGHVQSIERELSALQTP